jgi:DNA polymerase III alpha subunit (gram-positive type)
MSKHEELYVSTDIEADGPTPGLNSMLSLGSAVYDSGKQLIDTFYANLDTLPEASAHPVTEKWWTTQREAWQRCRENTEPPQVVMARYRDWVTRLPGKPVFVGYPVSFDFAFVNYYLMRFTGTNPFGFAALDVKTYAMALLGNEFRRTVKRDMPDHWFDDLPHTHVALDDAIEQGALFCNLLAERRRRLARQPLAEQDR